MEEKKATKISLSTFLLIIAIIALIIMGVFIYKLNIDKTTEIQKSSELQNQVNSLSGTVNDLQGKINSISETINANSSNEKIVDKDTNVTSNTSTQNKQNINNEKQKYVGTYKDSYGESSKIAINQNGELYLTREYDGKDVIDIIDLNKRDKNGSIIVYDNKDNLEQGIYKIVIYPIGVNIPLEDDNYFEYTDNETDINKIRIVSFNNLEGGIISCKVD